MTVTTNEKVIAAALPTRAAGLLTKSTAYGVAEKAIGQAIAARRVYPAMAEDFSAQLGHDLPLKTKDFVRVVGHLLSATEKPLKGIISKRKSEILAVLAEIVGALTDTSPMVLPAWALPKPKATKAAADDAAADGALEKANTLAAAESAAAAADARQDSKLATAVALVVARAAELTSEQRAMLASVLASTEESTEA